MKLMNFLDRLKDVVPGIVPNSLDMLVISRSGLLGNQPVAGTGESHQNDRAKFNPGISRSAGQDRADRRDFRFIARPLIRHKQLLVIIESPALFPPALGKTVALIDL